MFPVSALTWLPRSPFPESSSFLQLPLRSRGFALRQSVRHRERRSCSTSTLCPPLPLLPEPCGCSPQSVQHCSVRGFGDLQLLTGMLLPGTAASQPLCCPRDVPAPPVPHHSPGLWAACQTNPHRLRFTASTQETAGGESRGVKKQC